MDFDLSWFATVPGMFITGGVLLLIIALIILLITGKNSKKEKMAKATVSENANVPTQQNQNVVDHAITTVSLNFFELLTYLYRKLKA